VERLTRDIEEAADAYIGRIGSLGGAVSAIGFMQREIQDAAFRYQREVEDKTRIVVGVNEFVTPDQPGANLFAIDPGVGEALVERIRHLRRTRDADRAQRALDALEAGARGRANLLPLIVEAVDVAVTLGEICDRFRSVFGVHQPSVTF
jgi:methylmalonyl-CoA mutase N-terminal domain/subunit